MPIEFLNNIPSAIALLGLTIILFVLRRRQPQILIGAWTVALTVTCIRQSLWFYSGTSRRAGLAHIVIHVTWLLCDVVTGAAFLSFTGKYLPRARRHTTLIVLNTFPLAAIAIIYGLNFDHARAYFICSAIGILIVLATLRNSSISTAFPWIQIATWIVISTFAYFGNFRAATFWGLGGLFLNAAINSWNRLQKGSIGRLTFALSLTLWSLSLYIHASTIPNVIYRPVINEIWETQKFFAIIAMLIVLLEAETRENQRLALYDQLTGLSNRRLMEQRLLHAIAHGKAQVMLLDINNFKFTNDTLGHHVGDELLCQFAAQLQPLLGESDTLARLGGDEFVIVQPHPNDSLLKEIHAALPLSLSFENITHPIFASIGVSCFPQDAEGVTGQEAIKKLLRTADIRMYANKNLAPHRFATHS